MNKYRTLNCSELTEADKNKVVTLSGWVHIEKGPWKFTFYRFKRSFWFNPMCCRK